MIEYLLAISCILLAAILWILFNREIKLKVLISGEDQENNLMRVKIVDEV